MFKFNKLIFVLIFVLVFGVAFTANATAEKRSLTFGVMVPSQNNMFWVKVVQLAKQAAEQLGSKAIVLDAQDRAENQVGQLEDLITRGVDGMVICPVNTEIGKTLVNKCESAKIPVTIVDRNPGLYLRDFDYYVNFIGPSDWQGAYDATNYLLDRVKLGPEGKKLIVAITGVPGVSVTEDCEAGVYQALKEHPEAELLDMQAGNFLRDQGQKVMEDFLQRFPRIDGVWALNDDMMMGALVAIQNANRDKDMRSKDGVLCIVGRDIIEDACYAMQTNDVMLSVAGHWHHMALGIVSLYDYLHGIPPDDPFVLLEFMKVTPDNAKEFVENFYKKTPIFDWKSLSKVWTPDTRERYFQINLERIKLAAQ